MYSKFGLLGLWESICGVWVWIFKQKVNFASVIEFLALRGDIYFIFALFWSIAFASGIFYRCGCELCIRPRHTGANKVPTSCRMLLTTKTKLTSSLLVRK